MLALASPAFEPGGAIPSKYTCEGENISPPLAISGVPEGAQSLALIMDDPDVPRAIKPDGMFDHWVLFNIPPGTTVIAEGTNVGVVGMNTGGRAAYAGPCPPREYEPSEHRYSFRLYALDCMLKQQPGATKEALMKEMEGHIVVQTELLGRYRKQN